MKRLLTTLIIALLSITTQSIADENYNHFPSVPSNSLTEALCNLQNYNKKLSAITNKKTLSAVDMVKIHELTYTLENAVAKIQSELATVAENLEKVHKASERIDQDEISVSGQHYLKATTEITDGAACDGL